MMDLTFTFTAPLWEYKGQGSWHFVTLPSAISQDIKAFTKSTTRGFKTVRVTVKAGQSEWKTSLFPDNKAGAYLLPIKAAIRKTEGLKHGDMLDVTVSVLL